MRKQELIRFRNVLAEQLAALGRHGAATAQELAESGQELPDPTDRATRETDLEGELRMRDRDRHLASKIQAALARIDAGTFGTCLACGQAIPPERLRARPETDLCIDCKQEVERSRVRSG
jgi:DnaK suppressor protein